MYDGYKDVRPVSVMTTIELWNRHVNEGRDGFGRPAQQGAGTDTQRLQWAFEQLRSSSTDRSEMARFDAKQFVVVMSCICYNYYQQLIPREHSQSTLALTSPVSNPSTR